MSRSCLIPPQAVVAAYQKGGVICVVQFLQSSHSAAYEFLPFLDIRNDLDYVIYKSETFWMKLLFFWFEDYLCKLP